MLYDKEFLLRLDQYPHRVVYARITALTFQETPIEYIEGRVTQGSINIDGASAVRRSCSLTIAAPGFDYSDYSWGLNTKFKLEIGLENVIDSNYPDIIWFKQGIYLITSFNTARTTNNFTITIQGKDKMCLLNGEVGGALESSVDFGTIEEEDKNGNWITRKVAIPEIIRNAVHVYAKEPYHNIIINDLDTYGLELLEYRYDIPIYIYRRSHSPLFDNVILGNEVSKFYKKNKSDEFKLIDNLNSLSSEYLDLLNDSLLGSNTVKPVYYKQDSPPKDMTKVIKKGSYYYVPYILAKIEYGQTAGYRLTDLVYAGDLIANVGESITSVLDKIKNMLTEFEYFYNLDGQFVFQKKQSFKETILTLNQEQRNEELNKGILNSRGYSYEFYGGSLITSFNNNPNLLNLKNDYSVWGERDSVSGAKVPIHLRYAIDKKPLRYTSIEVKANEVKAYNDKYGTELKPQLLKKVGNSDQVKTFIAGDKYSIDGTNITCDWREIIYQMARDYYRYNFLDDFELRVAEANPEDYPTGRTGYEQYYIDMEGFWRQLYYPVDGSEWSEIKQEFEYYDLAIKSLNKKIYGEEVSWSEEPQGGIEKDIQNLNKTIAENNTEKITKLVNELTKKSLYKFYDSNQQLIEEPPLLLSLMQDLLFREQSRLSELEKKFNKIKKKKDKIEEDVLENYYIPLDEDGKIIASNFQSYWNKNVYETPELLNFWFDFLDVQGELEQFNVTSIGSRSKSTNDTNVKSIYLRETPSIIYLDSNVEFSVNQIPDGYRGIYIGGIDNMFSCSAKGKSAKEKLDELIYQHGYCIESATITSIPIYYLEPNTRIYLQDKETNLDGDYIVSKFTIPLNYNGTMSITATKAAENLI